MSVLASFVSNQLVTVVALVGLIVLVAMGKVDSNVALPIIVGLTGVHVGANLQSSNANAAAQAAKGSLPIPPA